MSKQLLLLAQYAYQCRKILYNTHMLFRSLGKNRNKYVTEQNFVFSKIVRKLVL